jgi:hypothetical protein
VDRDNAQVVHESKTLPASEFDGARSADFRYSPALDRLAPGEYLLRITADVAKSQAERLMRFTVK